MARKLIVEIVGDSRSYERALGRSEKATRNFGTTMQGTTKRVSVGFGTILKGAAVVGGVTAAFRGIGSAVRVGADEFSEMQKVAAQTAAVLKSTGGVAGVTAANVDTLATSLSQLSGVDDEAIASAENLILTFKNVRNVAGEGNQIFDRATLAALDLSKAAGGAFGDLPTTAKQLAKALNDPVRGMTALGRAGVTFSDSQKETIKGLVETGNTLAAQKLILREVESQVGGSAKAYGETFPGQLAKVREAFRNVFGNLATVVAEPLARALGAFSSFIPKIEAGTARLAAAVGPKLGEAFDVVLPMIQGLVRTIQQSLPNIQRIIGAIVEPIRTNVLPIVRDLQSVFQTAFQNITQALSDNAGSLRTIFSNLTTVMKNIWAIARPTIVFLFQTVLPAALRVVIPIIEKTTAVAKIMSQVWVTVASTIVKAISGLLGGFAKMADAASHLPFVGDKFKGVSDKINAARGELDTFAGGLDALDGKQVNVDIVLTSHRREEGDLTTRGRPKEPKEPEVTTPKVKPPVPPGQSPEEKRARAQAQAQARQERKREADEKAKQDAADAAAALRKRNERIRDAIKAEQFRAIGLTGTGEERTPGVEALAQRRKNLLQQIKGTTLDTSKTRGILKRIGRVLRGDFGKVGKDVRQAILGMFNDISSALSGGEEATGPLTKGAGLNTKKILEDMGLSPEEERELRGRLSSLGSGGQGLARPGGGTATTAARGGVGFGNNPPVLVESHTTINLDGQQVANVVTKQQQRGRRRNPQQKRGPNARR